VGKEGPEILCSCWFLLKLLNVGDGTVTRANICKACEYMKHI
jgi:hypothetical protein